MGIILDFPYLVCWYEVLTFDICQHCEVDEKTSTSHNVYKNKLHVCLGRLFNACIFMTST